MAGYDPGSLYDVGVPQAVNGLMDSGDAGMQVLQRELLRRAQFEQQAQETARQAALDAQAKQLHDAQLANTQENTRSQIQQRQAAEEQDRQKTLGLRSAAWTAQHTADENITDPNQLKEGLALNMIKAKPGTPAQEAVPEVPGVLAHDEMPDVAAVPAKPAVAATPDQNLNIGTVAQRDKAEEDAHIDDAAAGKYRDDPRYETDPKFKKVADYWETRATLKQMGIKDASGAAAFMKDAGAKKAPTSDERKAEIEDILATPPGERTAEQKKAVAGYEERLKHEAQIGKINPAVIIHETNATADQGRPEKPAAVQKYRGSTEKQLYVNETKATEHGAEADHLLASLHGKNGITDEAAVNQFLSMTSAGQGKGFRMTTAERDAIKHARSVLGNFEMFVNRIASGQQLSTAQRAAMEEVAQAYKGEADRIHKDFATARTSMRGVKSSAEINDIVSDLRDTIVTSADKASPGAADTTPDSGSSYYDRYLKNKK